MKRFINFALITIIALSFQSCESEKTKEITSSSSDGKMNISIVGERSSSADPYTVTITCDQFENSVTTEIYASKLDSTNVKFDWSSNSSCLISITQRDGQVSKIPVQVSVQ